MTDHDKTSNIWDYPQATNQFVLITVKLSIGIRLFRTCLASVIATKRYTKIVRMRRFLNSILMAVALTSLIASSSTLSVNLKGKVLDNGKEGSYDPFSWSEQPSWKINADRENKPSAVDWDDAEYRLPGDLLPSVYTIRLLPFIEEGNFTTDGYIEIYVDCVNDTKNIVLNSVDIDIHQLSITVSHVTPFRVYFCSIHQMSTACYVLHTSIIDDSEARH